MRDRKIEKKEDKKQKEEKGKESEKGRAVSQNGLEF